MDQQKETIVYQLVRVEGWPDSEPMLTLEVLAGQTVVHRLAALRDSDNYYLNNEIALTPDKRFGFRLHSPRLASTTDVVTSASPYQTKECIPFSNGVAIVATKRRVRAQPLRTITLRVNSASLTARACSRLDLFVRVCFGGKTERTNIAQVCKSCFKWEADFKFEVSGFQRVNFQVWDQYEESRLLGVAMIVVGQFEFIQRTELKIFKNLKYQGSLSIMGGLMTSLPSIGVQDEQVEFKVRFGKLQFVEEVSFTDLKFVCQLIQEEEVFKCRPKMLKPNCFAINKELDLVGKQRSCVQLSLLRGKQVICQTKLTLGQMKSRSIELLDQLYRVVCRLELKQADKDRKSARASGSQLSNSQISQSSRSSKPLSSDYRLQVGKFNIHPSSLQINSNRSNQVVNLPPLDFGSQALPNEQRYGLLQKQQQLGPRLNASKSIPTMEKRVAEPPLKSVNAEKTLALNRKYQVNSRQVKEQQSKSIRNTSLADQDTRIMSISPAQTDKAGSIRNVISGSAGGQVVSMSLLQGTSYCLEGRSKEEEWRCKVMNLRLQPLSRAIPDQLQRSVQRGFYQILKRKPEKPRKFLAEYLQSLEGRQI